MSTSSTNGEPQWRVYTQWLKPLGDEVPTKYHGNEGDMMRRRNSLQAWFNRKKGDGVVRVFIKPTKLSAPPKQPKLF